MKKYFIPLVLAIFFNPSPAEALSCAPPEIVESFDHWSAVLIGTVEGSSKGAKVSDMEVDVTVSLRIEEAFKGDDLPEVIRFSTNVYWGDIFTVGERYLVYLNQRDGKYVNDLCSGSKPLRYANEDIQTLRELTGVGLVFCPEDAMLCPDGTSVVRIPPNCEFEKCPE